MIKYLKIGFIPLFAIAVAGCADDFMQQEPDRQTDMPIVLSAAYPTATRATDAGFEDGDRMGVYVLDYTDGDTPQDISSSAHASNTLFTFDGNSNKWTSLNQLYWTSSSTPADIVGYYPFVSDIDDPLEVPFQLSRRQDVTGTETEPGGYEQSDFLWGKSIKTMPGSEPVNLTCRHLMAGARIALREGTGFSSGEWNSLEKIVIMQNITPNASINLAEGKVTATGGDPIAVTPYEYNGEWRAVVVPQTVGAGKPVVGITVDGKSYNLVRETDTEYVAGKLHAFTITVNRNTADGKYSFVISDESITPWLDDAEFRDGLIRDYITIEVPRRGTMRECVSALGIDIMQLSNVKIKGEINEDDFRFMRDDIPGLKNLNLYECEVYCEDIKGRIPYEAMYGKTTLSHVIFPKNLQNIEERSFEATGLMGDLIIPEGVRQIGNNGFLNCNNLCGSLTLPSTLKHIGANAFRFTFLQGELTLPESVTFIGETAFTGTRFTGSLSLPENLTYIGNTAFRDVPFTGELEIPRKIKKVNDMAFMGCKFTLLTLHEGLEEIAPTAFGFTELRGELNIPSTVRNIGNGAFAQTKISSVILPENLVYLGKSAFEGCARLEGSITIPKKILAINDNLFKDCSMLEEVIMHENVSKIGPSAFGNCYNLTSIVINNPDPPTLVKGVNYGETFDAFEGVPKDNFTIQVPAKSVETYRNAEGWREFKRIAAYSNFVCRPAQANALSSRHESELVLNSDGAWTVTHKPDWVTLNHTSGSGKTAIRLTFDEMDATSGVREDYVEFALAGTEFTTRCDVSQYGYRYAEDQCITLQKATKGNGIDVLFLGDGFDAKAIAEGEYLNLVKEQMEYFFGLEPYATYRDRFNVYACISLSQETGVNTHNSWRDTRFMTLYARPEGCQKGTLKPENADDVFNYAVANSPLTQEKMPRSLVIMTLNCSDYGSATTLTERGSAISICPRSQDAYPMDTRGLLQHEACGHGFGKLAEERITANRYVNKSEKAMIEESHWRGWFQNISITGKMNEVYWRDFIFDTRYSDKVDIFEGAFGVTRGVFRSEANSCMNYGIPYLNVASRLSIMHRILDYSGEGFSMEKFYATDSDKWGTSATRSAAGKPTGLHHPVRIIKSKKY